MLGDSCLRWVVGVAAVVAAGVAARADGPCALYVRSDTGSADLFLDGRFVGRLSEGAPELTVELGEGGHTVVARQGPLMYEKPFRVSREQRTYLVCLPPATAWRRDEPPAAQRLPAFAWALTVGGGLVVALWAARRRRAWKVRVLILTANPPQTVCLSTDVEVRDIEHAIRLSKHRNGLKVTVKSAVRAEDIQPALLRHRPHLVQISSHVEASGALLLEGTGTAATPLPAQALRALFRTFKDDIRVVILNACHTEALAEALAEVIDCAIGMHGTIPDEAAIAFAAAFYGAIGFGCDVQKAFEAGLASVQRHPVPPAVWPRLFVRKGVDASRVVLLGAG
jgi:hypothetical protein